MVSGAAITHYVIEQREGGSDDFAVEFELPVETLEMIYTEEAENEEGKEEAGKSQTGKDAATAGAAGAKTKDKANDAKVNAKGKQEEEEEEEVTWYTRRMTSLFAASFYDFR